ncbi:class F sortase [Solihabitans fulvus]|uniref:Class F sortase n=1 Tax=Solihabitans fulvus TaxID=1892852 RepID=A0A5B2XL54_9PSEU|nr:class F sortase [Solihabitans fulvus]
MSGCGSSAASGGAAPTGAAPTGGQSATAGNTQAATPPTQQRVQPAGVEVPRIGAKSTLVPLGLNADKTVQVPPVEQQMQAGWYTGGPNPGEVGPSVILGHVDGAGKPGIFNRLHEVKAGDEVLVTRTDGKVLRFVVSRTEQVAKSGFPSDAVYGDTTKPELRLITCGGSFDGAAHSYRDNIIVYAALAS